MINVVCRHEDEPGCGAIDLRDAQIESNPVRIGSKKMEIEIGSIFRKIFQPRTKNDLQKLKKKTEKKLNFCARFSFIKS